MNLDKIIKGSLAAIIIYLILSFPVTATPLFPEKGGPYSGEIDNPAVCPDKTAESVDPSAGEWRKYDINADGRFDTDDIDEFIGNGGIGFINDLNSDGKKDLTDAFALYVKLAVLDRNCDEAVDDTDFTPVEPVTLPRPDAAIVWSLVSRIVTEAAMKLPADIETQVFRSLPAEKSLNPLEKAQILETTGMSALLQLNLEGAQWAYGRAFQTNNRSATALGSLGFAIAMARRHNEALSLLSYARELYPESGATSTSIAWIFARHGQDEEALAYYREAVKYAPKIAHYHMNLGIAYLRVGNTKIACEEFRIASELDPGDFHALLFRHVVPGEIPPQQTPVDLNKMKEEDHLQIKEFQESGATDDELPTPWDECSPCEQAKKIPELLERRDIRKYEQVARSYADEMAKKRNDWAVAHAPKLKKSSEDLKRWTEWFGGQKRLDAEEISLENALGALESSLTKQRGNEIMSYSSFFMECAVQQAKSDARTMLDNLSERTRNLQVTPASRAQIETETYRDAIDEAIKDCYIDPMLTAASLLRSESTPESLPVSHIEVLDLTFFYPFTWSDACLTVPGYYDGGDKPSVSGIGDNTFSLNLWVASFEYNYNTGEWELRILPGTGVILGATWSPDSGFGFQAGADLGLDLMVAGFNLEGYFEVNKNGLTLKGEAGAFVNLSILEAGLETSGSVPVIPFQATTSEPLPDFVID